MELANNKTNIDKLIDLLKNNNLSPYKINVSDDYFYQVSDVYFKENEDNIVSVTSTKLHARLLYANSIDAFKDIKTLMKLI